MTRDAKLYFLTHIPWWLLADAIERHPNYAVHNDVTIFQLPSEAGKQEYFAVLSLSDDADKVILEHGAKEAAEKDYMRITLHEYYGEPLYGEKSNLIYLNKFI